ncbi:receptor-like protein EIX1 [Salvia hispanica]|uniref:receptor-like protein EIX1 n=1 Tax=Salvia hispanica TaxID=49212 RepID=UPI0020090177|nr:receptor-like protein EIX1 [Salvia hispanica]
MISDKKIAIKFLLFVLVCLFVLGDAEVRCIEREREALLSFKNGLIDDYGCLSSWQSDKCCKWYGVWCSNTTGHVIALRLNSDDYGGKLRGEVGSSLLKLHHLNYLDLGSNDFGGNPIPKFIGSTKQLQHLYLVRSNFSGIVPPQIGNLTNLQSLSLSFNSLRIENLDWLSSLSQLSYLDLSQIDLSHTNWLQNILSVRSLDKLYLNSCNIKDAEPSVNSSSISLSVISMYSNNLTSSSFHWLSNISTNLVYMDISGNALDGPIPDSFIERLVLIEDLYLSGNKLEGQIPKSLSNLGHLRALLLYGNGFKGDLDDLFGNNLGKEYLNHSKFWT